MLYKVMKTLKINTL